MSDLQQRVQAALGDAYEVVRELGGGGMSHVFLAVERKLDREVVIKVLPPDLVGGVSLDRFHREIQVVAKLQHPHIVPVLTVGDVGGVPFFTMPYVTGRSLRELLRAGAPMPVTEALHVLRDVATALAFAHDRGIVHRDIKPDNVLLSGGAAMVTDFGVAKAIAAASRGGDRPERIDGARDHSTSSLTALGTSLGTPMYMAPEQAAGDPLTDHRADLYSFGAMAFEVVTGTPPFAGRSPAALLAAQMTEVPPPVSVARPDAPAPFVALVQRCLEKDPAKRPQTALEVVRELDRALGLATGEGGTVPAFAPAVVVPRRAMPRAAIVLAAAVVAIIVGVVAWRTRSSASTSGASTTVAAPNSQSIAVLPLENVGGSEQDRYFSDGMTDEITSALSKVSGLKVASRTSVFALAKKGLGAQEIARTLRVAHVLEGTVRRAGDRLRVSAQLTNASDGLALWSESYERQLRDVFQVQDDIAGNIAGALKITLASNGGASAANGERSTSFAAAPRGTENLEAYDLYLRGRFFWHQRGQDALQRAAGYFQQAIDRDPRYARAYAGLADALGLLPIYGTTPSDSAFPLARKAAEKALTLDSTLAEANATLGLILKSTGHWAESETAFRKAIALDSTYATAHQWYGETLVITGRVDEAVTQFAISSELEPLSAIASAELAYGLGLAGKHKEGVIAGRRAIELDSTLWTGHAFLAFVHLFGGDRANGLAEMKNAVRLEPRLDPLAGALAYAYATTGHADSARALLPPIEARAKKPGGSPVALAMAYAGLGDSEQALTWLLKGAREHDPWLYAMSIDAPVYATLMGDPRFAEVARVMGLEPAAMVRRTTR